MIKNVPFREERAADAVQSLVEKPGRGQPLFYLPKTITN